MTEVVIRGTPYPVLLPRLRDPRLHLAATITSLQVIGQVGFHFRVSIAQILISVLTCALLEVAIAAWRQRVILWPASALITGNGVAFILRVPGTSHGDWWSLRGWWIFAATGAVSLLSKHLIRVRGEHVFNPSNIGLVLCFLLLGRARAVPLDFWWGPMSAWLALALGVILVAGFLILSRLGLLWIAVGFWLSFAVGIAVLAASGHQMSSRWHLGPVSGAYFWWVLLTSPEVLVFLFFMITDPKTAPSGSRARVVYAVAIGLLAALLIAPTRTEFAAKVALLGALAVVCLVRTLAGLVRWQVAPRRLVLLGAGGVAAYAVVLVLIATTPPSSAAGTTATGALPPITILRSRGVQNQLTLPLAKEIAHDLLAAAPVVNEDHVRLWLEAGQGQAPPIAVAELAGVTYRLHQDGGRWMITARTRTPATVPGLASAEVSVKLTAAASSVPQGRPFAFSFTVSSDKRLSGDVTFVVLPVGHPEQAVDFDRQLATVAPNRSAKLDGSVTTSQWFPRPGRYEVRAAIASAPVGKPLLFTVTHPRIEGPRFRDVTQQLGLQTSIPGDPCGEWSSGAAWADVNGDGRLDLYVTRLSEPPKLFINHGSRGFVDETSSRGVGNGGRVALGASFADYNNDGHPDLFVANDGPDRLYRNDGTGHFVDVARHAGVDDKWDSMSGSWVDYNNDGYLDLYVANHARCPSSGRSINALKGLQYEPDHLYRNNGDGTFTEVTSLLGPNATRGAGFLGSWFDYNDDGRQDLYLANDWVGTRPDRNHLWRSDGPGPGGTWRFDDVSTASGTAFSMNTMGVGIGDYNRDGRLDLALTNIAANRLLRNDGNGRFTDVARPAGVAHPSQQAGERDVTWGATFGDFNLDGWEDLYLGAGYLWTLNVWYGERSVALPNELYVNDHHSAFLDLSAPSGAADRGRTRGIAVADFNRDGRLDLFVVNQHGNPHLYENVTPFDGNHWLEVRTVGTVSNRDGCGARVVVTVARAKLVREVECGSTSVSSSADKVVHFGLGHATNVKLTITWPSGIRQTIEHPRVDRLMTVTEAKAG